MPAGSVRHAVSPWRSRRRISWPCRSRSGVPMILVNWAADRCSGLCTSRALDAVLGVAGAAAASVPGPHHPAAHVPDGLDRQLHHVEQVRGQVARGSMQRTAEE